MAQWQQVSPTFSRGITTAMSNAQQGISDVGRVAGDYLLRQDKLAQEEARKAERKQDVDFRQAQADQIQGNFLKSFRLQQNADDRAKAEQLAKENTRQAYGQFGELATAPNQTQAQVQAIMRPDSILSKAQAQGRVLTPKEEASLLGQVNADLNKNKGSLTQQRQVLLEQGPVSELYDVVKDPVTGAKTVRTRKDIDTTSQQDYKGKLLDNLDRRIGDEAKLAQDLSLAKMREAGDNARLNRTLRAKEKEAKEPKFQAYEVTIYRDRNGKVVDNPSMGKPTLVRVDNPTEERKLYAEAGVRDPKNPNEFVGLKGFTGKGAEYAPDKGIYGASNIKNLEGLDFLPGKSTQSTAAIGQAGTLLRKIPGMSPEDAVGIVSEALSNSLDDSVSNAEINTILKGRGLKQRLAE